MNAALYQKEIEEIVRKRDGLDAHSRATLRSVIRKLIERAQPGNGAWQRLQNEFGFVGDYSDADWGEPPERR